MKNDNPPLSTLCSPLSAVLIVVIAVLMNSCISEEVSHLYYPEKSDPVKAGYIKIHLNTPGPHIPTAKTYGSRAMNSQMEMAIDSELLNILVFNYSDDGNGNISETFNYKASVSGSIEYDKNGGSNAIVNVRLIKSVSSNDFYRIVVIANHDMSEINMVSNVTTKKDILEQLTYLVP